MELKRPNVQMFAKLALEMASVQAGTTLIPIYYGKEMDSFLSSCAKQIRKAMELRKEAFELGMKGALLTLEDRDGATTEGCDKMEQEEKLNAKADQMLENVIKKLKGDVK